MNRQVYGRTKTPRRTLRATGRSPELHCMLIPAGQETLLLPNSVMAEVIDFQPPTPIEQAPPWLLGHVEWESRQVPVFSFSDLINGSQPTQPSSRSRIMILKSLTEGGRVPYLGLMLGGLPKPITVQPEGLEQTGDEKKALGVFSRVRLEDGDAIVPDLDRLTHLVTHAAFGALPITRLDD
jgi:chemosensory pili system protein ChpC